MERPNHALCQLTASLRGQDEEKLRQVLELLFFAYRDFTGEADAVLADFGFGRAHHRAIYFIGRNPNISVSDLLGILKITKQSLNRVLKDLIKLEVILFEKDQIDTRVKHIFLNEKGKKIFNEIFEVQKKRIYTALLNSSSEEVINFDNVLKKIING